MNDKQMFVFALRETIDKNKHDRILIEELKSKLFELGISRGETQRIIMGNVLIEELDKRTLINFSVTLLNSIDKLINAKHSRELYPLEISPLKIFSPSEIAEAAKPVEPTEDEESTEFPILIQKAWQDGEDSFNVLMPMNQLVQMFKSNRLEYNYDINKQYKFVKKTARGKDAELVSNKTIMKKTIDLNLNKVKAIAEDIKNNVHEFTDITLNVLKGSSSESAEIEYNPKNHSLTIHPSKIDIINGMHEINAMVYVAEAIPNNKIKVEITIKNYDFNTIKAYFNQINIKGSVN